MLLAVDVGNTNTVLGLYRLDKCVSPQTKVFFALRHTLE